MDEIEAAQEAIDPEQEAESGDQLPVQDETDDGGQPPSLDDPGQIDVPLIEDVTPPYSDPVQTDIISLAPGLDLTIRYEITAGDLLLASLLTFLIFSFLLYFVHRVIFRRG